MMTTGIVPQLTGQLLAGMGRMEPLLATESMSLLFKLLSSQPCSTAASVGILCNVVARALTNPAVEVKCLALKLLQLVVMTDKVGGLWKQ